MKTTPQLIFDKIIKESFHKTLKPLGFKKKGNNFYLPLLEVGQIINIQKSMYSSGEIVKFTINVGIFVPELFLSSFWYEKQIPEYPAESACAFRNRIGYLRGESDVWYEVNFKTNFDNICAMMQDNLDKYILPHLTKWSSKSKIITAMETRSAPEGDLTKLWVYREFKEFEKAKAEYKLIIGSSKNVRVLDRAKEIAEECDFLLDK